MAPWHLNPMAPWDCETTGVDVERDRIVTACVGLLRPASPKWDVQIRSWLINPGVDIPEEASAIHGVTTVFAKENGTEPAEALDLIAAELALAMSAGYPLVGSNLAYDNTIADRELRRHGLPTVEERLGRPLGPCIDVYVIDKQVDPYRKGSRKLEALCEHYGVRIDGAHDSTFDALAAARIAYRIAQRYPQIARMSLDELHRAQVGWRRAQQASLADYFRRQGKPFDDVDGHWPLRPYLVQEAML